MKECGKAPQRRTGDGLISVNEQDLHHTGKTSARKNRFGKSADKGSIRSEKTRPENDSKCIRQAVMEAAFAPHPGLGAVRMPG